MRKILKLILLLVFANTFAQTTTWNGTTWSNGNPNSTLDVVINGNYTVGVNTPAATVLNCKTLTVNTGYTFTVASNFYIDIWNGNFTNNGTVIFQNTTDIIMRAGVIVNNSSSNNFIFEDGSALIQLTNTLQTTPVTFQRKTKPVKLNDYTYWSSPIRTQSYMQLPPFSNIRVFSYNQTGWVREWGGNMTTGKGYIAHRPIVNDPNPQQIYTMNFVGLPNNGNISITSTSDANGFHLLGNPYPSTLDAVTFMLDNSGGGNRVNALYFWTHNTVISSAIPGSWTYNYTADDYAAITRSGGTFLASVAPSPINDSTPNNNTVPTGNIASGQGFFVKMRDAGSRTFNFNNGQKSYLPFGPNTQFFREVPEVTPSKKLWLYLSDNEYLHRNMLISHIEGATNDYDDGYEAEIPLTTQAAIYSLLDDKKLLIQGRESDINKTDRIALGYKTFKPGSYSIGIYRKEGLDKESIILFDKLLGVYQNISYYPYIFNSNSGEVNDRFELIYKKETQLSNTDILTYILDEYLVISNPSKEDILEVKIYDILGNLIISKEKLGKHIDIKIPFNVSSGTYLVNIKTKDNINIKIIK